MVGFIGPLDVGTENQGGRIRRPLPLARVPDD